jgi:hypothetical protein
LLALALIGGGVVLGFAVDRSWALPAPIVFAVWIDATGSPDFFGAADISRGGAAAVVGVWGVAAVLAGIGIRRLARRARTG